VDGRGSEFSGPRVFSSGGWTDLSRRVRVVVGQQIEVDTVGCGYRIKAFAGATIGFGILANYSGQQKPLRVLQIGD
jgi:hypothetical protein